MTPCDTTWSPSIEDCTFISLSPSTTNNHAMIQEGRRRRRRVFRVTEWPVTDRTTTTTITIPPPCAIVVVVVAAAVDAPEHPAAPLSDEYVRSEIVLAGHMLLPAGPPSDPNARTQVLSCAAMCRHVIPSDPNARTQVWSQVVASSFAVYITVHSTLDTFPFLSPISHSHLPSPISHLPSPISHLPIPSPISHLPFPITHYAIAPCRVVSCRVVACCRSSRSRTSRAAARPTPRPAAPRAVFDTPAQWMAARPHRAADEKMCRRLPSPPLPSLPPDRSAPSSGTKTAS